MYIVKHRYIEYTEYTARMVNIGINGFGRIGRLAYRIGVTKHADELAFAAINTSGSMDAAGWAHLVNYDTMYRKFEKEVKGINEKDPKDVTDFPCQISSAGFCNALP